MHKLLGGLCAALLFLAGLPQIGHAADPVPFGRGFVVQDMDGDITAYEVR